MEKGSVGSWFGGIGALVGGTVGGVSKIEKASVEEEEGALF